MQGKLKSIEGKIGLQTIDEIDNEFNVYQKQQLDILTINFQKQA